MENVPKHIDLEKLTQALLALPDVANVHDLHVWNLSIGKPALSVHLLVKATTLDADRRVMPACIDGVLRRAQKVCAKQFHIQHSTIQIEYPRDHHVEIHDCSCPPYCAEETKPSSCHEDHNDKEKNRKEDVKNDHKEEEHHHHDDEYHRQSDDEDNSDADHEHHHKHKEKDSNKDSHGHGKSDSNQE